MWIQLAARRLRRRRGRRRGQRRADKDPPGGGTEPPPVPRRAGATPEASPYPWRRLGCQPHSVNDPFFPPPPPPPTVISSVDGASMEGPRVSILDPDVRERVVDHVGPDGLDAQVVPVHDPSCRIDLGRRRSVEHGAARARPAGRSSGSPRPPARVSVCGVTGWLTNPLVRSLAARVPYGDSRSSMLGSSFTTVHPVRAPSTSIWSAKSPITMSPMPHSAGDPATSRGPSKWRAGPIRTRRGERPGRPRSGRR